MGNDNLFGGAGDDYMFAGQGNGRFRQGRHLVFPKRTPAANLYLTMLQSVGVAAERFADSTGRLAV